MMTAIAKTFSSVTATFPDLDILKTVGLFCGIGLAVSLILACYGLEISEAFF
jgi:hypothetical protein